MNNDEFDETMKDIKGKNYKLEAIYSKYRTSSDLYKGFELLIKELDK